MTVLLDLDGTLLDFATPACELLGIDYVYDNPKNYGIANIENIVGMPKKEFYNKLGYEFWANLTFLPDAHKILDIVEQAYPGNVILLTKLIDNPGCAQGKLDCIKRLLPQYYHKTLLCTGYIKHHCSSRHHILIEDNELNVKDFENEGGQAFLLPRPWNSDWEYKDIAVESLKLMISTCKRGIRTSCI